MTLPRMIGSENTVVWTAASREECLAMTSIGRLSGVSTMPMGTETLYALVHPWRLIRRPLSKIVYQFTELFAERGYARCQY
jgi:hypothetical protein